MSRPPVGVVIVNHNLKDSLRETLESFRQVRYPDLRVVVSDNASRDGSREMVRDEFPEVRLLAHDPEQGYARAASLGLAALLEETRYIFSTTNDVLIDPDMIGVLVDHAEQHPDVGVIGTKILFHDRPDHLWHAGARVHPLHGHTYHFGWNRRDHPRYNRIRECDFVTGCGFMLRTEALRKAGLFRDDLIFYAEDADLCYRVRAAGYRIEYLPTAKLWHKVGSTLARNRPLQLQYSTRNGLYLLQRHRVGWYPLSLWVHLGIVSPVKMGVFLLLGTPRNAVGIWRGISDWRRGRTGWIR